MAGKLVLFGFASGKALIVDKAGIGFAGEARKC